MSHNGRSVALVTEAMRTPRLHSLSLLLPLLGTAACFPPLEADDQPPTASNLDAAVSTSTDAARNDAMPSHIPPVVDASLTPKADPHDGGSCDGLPPAECSITPTCAVFVAHAFDLARGCRTGKQDPICRDFFTTVLRDGPSRLVFAADPTGRVWQALASALPAEWKLLESQPDFPAEVDCIAPDVESACAQHQNAASCFKDAYHDCHTQLAQRYSDAHGCLRWDSEDDLFLRCTALPDASPSFAYFQAPPNDIWQVRIGDIAFVPSHWTLLHLSVLPAGVTQPCAIEL